MRIFIGGIMQGSHQTNDMVDQRYREAISDALLLRWPDLEVVDPLRLHPESLTYDDDSARRTLLTMFELAGQSDLVIAYLPTASMGTALEIYFAYRRGVPVAVVSPMAHNWVLRAFAQRIYPDLESLFSAIRMADSPYGLVSDRAFAAKRTPLD